MSQKHVQVLQKHLVMQVLSSDVCNKANMAVFYWCVYRTLLNSYTITQPCAHIIVIRLLVNQYTTGVYCF